MTDLLLVLLVALCFVMSLVAVVVCAHITESGSLQVEATNDLVGLDEVLPVALDNLGLRGPTVQIDVLEVRPAVVADLGLF